MRVTNTIYGIQGIPFVTLDHTKIIPQFDANSINGLIIECQKWAEQITKNQVQVFRKWFGSDCQQINESFKNTLLKNSGDSSLLEPFMFALEDAPTSGNRVIFRGSRAPDNLHVGMIMEKPRFQSWSLSPKIARGFACWPYVIYWTRYNAGRYVDYASGHGRKNGHTPDRCEEEVILPPNRCEIKSIKFVEWDDRVYAFVGVKITEKWQWSKESLCD